MRKSKSITCRFVFFYPPVLEFSRILSFAIIIFSNFMKHNITWNADKIEILQTLLILLSIWLLFVAICKWISTSTLFTRFQTSDSLRGFFLMFVFDELQFFYLQKFYFRCNFSQQDSVLWSSTFKKLSPEKRLNFSIESECDKSLVNK